MRAPSILIYPGSTVLPLVKKEFLPVCVNKIMQKRTLFDNNTSTYPTN